MYWPDFAISLVLLISGIGKLVDYADGIRCVVDDVPSHGRPDESGSAGYDDTVHDKVIDSNDSSWGL